MLTLSEVNATTNSHDGDIFSDLHKDVYGFRPRNVTFESVEHFDAEYERLVKRLSEKLEQEKFEKAIRWSEFLDRIDTIKELVSNVDTVRACEILCDAEGIDAEERSFYGWESLEWKLGLQFGSIKQMIKGEL